MSDFEFEKIVKLVVGVERGTQRTFVLAYIDGVERDRIEVSSLAEADTVMGEFSRNILRQFPGAQILAHAQ